MTRGLAPGIVGTYDTALRAVTPRRCTRRTWSPFRGSQRPRACAAWGRSSDRPERFGGRHRGNRTDTGPPSVWRYRPGRAPGEGQQRPPAGLRGPLFVASTTPKDMRQPPVLGVTGGCVPSLCGEPTGKAVGGGPSVDSPVTARCPQLAARNPCPAPTRVWSPASREPTARTLRAALAGDLPEGLAPFRVDNGPRHSAPGAVVPGGIGALRRLRSRRRDYGPPRSARASSRSLWRCWPSQGLLFRPRRC